jgi:hypothetical protein
LESSSENGDANAKDILETPKEKNLPKEPSQIDGTLAMQKIPAESKGPRLIFSIRLNDTFRPEADMLDHFTDWMRSFPTIAHEIKVEAVFDSLSTLVLVSLPMYISAYLPQDPAIVPLGPITSPNRIHPSCSFEHNTKPICLGPPEQNVGHATSDPPSSKAGGPKDLLVDGTSISSLGPLLPTQSLFAGKLLGHAYQNFSLSPRNNGLNWGRLFDNGGNPTSRLGQFLRGFANHIVGATTFYSMSDCLLTLA